MIFAFLWDANGANKMYLGQYISLYIFSLSHNKNSQKFAMFSGVTASSGLPGLGA